MVFRREAPAISAAQYGAVSGPETQPDLHLCRRRCLLGRHRARPVEAHIRARQQHHKQLGRHGGRAGLLLPQAGRQWQLGAHRPADCHDRAHREPGLRTKEYVVIMFRYKIVCMENVC
jgi:hypothetical protein